MDTEPAMLTTYERRLVLGYLANAVSSLHRVAHRGEHLDPARTPFEAELEIELVRRHAGPLRRPGLRCRP